MADLTEDQAEQAAADLLELRKLVDLPAWSQMFAAYLQEKEVEHLAGSTALNVAPDKRAEHIQAYHLAKDLPKWAAKRIADLETKLKTFRQKRG